ncbi:beta-carotene 15,15'-dioxygenase, Brp/Blh family [Ascidiimonas sp. W6]|uniref:Brp/Blh family beta-carotene 15,15'-dioxygenase n=1 Tax=Ascidiimonas meishanensis TaxID=3128903 RepID=UPI0030EEA666
MPSNYKNFTIVTTFFALWLAVSFEQQTEDFLAYMLIFSFGILHGANDLKLVQSLHGGRKSISFFKTAIYYILIVGVGVILFYFIPVFGLAVFILFSGYHFGEQHLEKIFKKRSPLRGSAFLSYGMLILFLLFLANPDEVSLIIKDMTGIYLNATVYEYSFAVCLLIFSGCSFALISVKENYKIFIKEVFYIVVFFVVFKTASLLWAFSIYFILWHSLPSLIDQIIYLYGSFNKKSIWMYLKSSLFTWIISLVGLGILYLIFNSEEKLFLSVFFSFLAAITFPHVLVMSKLRK